MKYEQFIKLNPEGEIYDKTYTNYLSAKLSQVNNYLLSKSKNIDDLLKFEEMNEDLLNIIAECIGVFIEEIEIYEDLKNPNVELSHL